MEGEDCKIKKNINKRKHLRKSKKKSSLKLNEIDKKLQQDEIFSDNLD